ncbi:sigma-54 dependent transcriptional regulator [Desulfopila sp. IMCC35008]|uniref:sigma-54-dependent transcriptional regulator n=1 Tax=Desulfopila sp. IMCC35008 TaxID=2653858 RepID=UPI0013D8A068|nr:sigma-54 dependent transcriptional regulator [Desulfopila sp. IMCC35008]
MKLLIIDDEVNMLHMLQKLLERSGYDVTTAEDGLKGLEMIEQSRFDFILCDVKMPHVDGLAFLEKGFAHLDQSTVIMMSAYGTIDLAINAMKLGAYDFISKPFKTDEVLLALRKAEERERLRKENTALKRELDALRSNNGFGSMIGSSVRMQEMYSLARRVSQYNTTILITGESGTGKELVARGIHLESARNQNPFVAINCGSIPENLMESELFGYVKGAFTGADRDKPGLFDSAYGGTLFLDEIGELPVTLQVKLLRVLQENEIRPIGAQKTHAIDVRILAATAQDLERLIEEGLFREDLFYRLNVVRLKVPPLREREEDIVDICHHFIKIFNNTLGTSISGLSSEAISCLMSYGWPGNVRELENSIQRGMVMAGEGVLEKEHFPKNIAHPELVDLKGIFLDQAGGGLSLKVAQKQLEKKLISMVLTQTGGNKSRAASQLEISYPSLLSKIKQYEL